MIPDSFSAVRVGVGVGGGNGGVSVAVSVLVGLVAAVATVITARILMYQENSIW